jgi:hypothetical protein
MNIVTTKDPDSQAGARTHTNNMFVCVENVCSIVWVEDIFLLLFVVASVLIIVC